MKEEHINIKYQVLLASSIKRFASQLLGNIHNRSNVNVSQMKLLSNMFRVAHVRTDLTLQHNKESIVDARYHVCLAGSLIIHDNRVQKYCSGDLYLMLIILNF